MTRLTVNVDVDVDVDVILEEVDTESLIKELRRREYNAIGSESDHELQVTADQLRILLAQNRRDEAFQLAISKIEDACGRSIQ